MTDLSIVPYRPDPAAAWSALNEHWILSGGYALEATGQSVLGDPVVTILIVGARLAALTFDAVSPRSSRP